MKDGRLGWVPVAKHRIRLCKEAAQIQSHHFSTRSRPRQLERGKVDKMVKYNVAYGAATAGWASPFVFLPQEDNSIGFCVDHCKLNTVIMRDSYSILLMNRCVDSYGATNVFSTLDTNSGYWEINLDKNDFDMTAFATRNELYRYMRMPFESNTVSATFQQTVDIILAPGKLQHALVYVDNIVIFFRPSEEHLNYFLSA